MFMQVMITQQLTQSSLKAFFGFKWSKRILDSRKGPRVGFCWVWEVWACRLFSRPAWAEGRVTMGLADLFRPGGGRASLLLWELCCTQWVGSVFTRLQGVYVGDAPTVPLFRLLVVHKAWQPCLKILLKCCIHSCSGNKSAAQGTRPLSLQGSWRSDAANPRMLMVGSAQQWHCKGWAEATFPCSWVPFQSFSPVAQNSFNHLPRACQNPHLTGERTDTLRGQIPRSVASACEVNPAQRSG